MHCVIAVADADVIAVRASLATVARLESINY